MSHQPEKNLTMNAIDTTKTDLHWNVLTIKGPGLVRDLPPGKEELRWVAHSSTLISGERGADRYGSLHLLARPVDRTDRWRGTPSTTEFIPISARPTHGAGLEWISTLDKLEALKPKAVVAGHKVPENDDDPRIIAETRQYLRDFNRLNEATVNARELYDAMLELYPDRVNPGSLWGAANTAKKQA
jgi:hypothetical protein